MGTIFGVYSEQPPTVGTNLLAAGFVIYGPITSMVVARDGSVREYILEDGDKRVVDDDVTVPEDPTVFGFGGGVDSWTDEFESYAEDVRHELKLRYGGAMVADINQVLTYGGIFSYPALESRPEGKLRVQFEGQPMATSSNRPAVGPPTATSRCSKSSPTSYTSGRRCISGTTT